MGVSKWAPPYPPLVPIANQKTLSRCLVAVFDREASALDILPVHGRWLLVRMTMVVSRFPRAGAGTYVGNGEINGPECL